MIQHPLPPHILQTSLNHLPLASSQLASQITKKQLEMKKFIQENIHACLDLFKSNQDLLIKLKETNKSCDQLKNWESEFKKLTKSIDSQEPEQNVQPSDLLQNEDRIKVAIRHANLEDVMKFFPLLTQKQQIKIGSIIPSQLPMPNRINRPRIVNTLKMLTSSANLPLDMKDQILQTSFKTLIQKFYKLKIELKSFQTNRNQKSYFFDILQLYQKCFNKTMKILNQACESDLNPTLAKIITNVANKTRFNILSLLSQTRPDEKTVILLLALQEFKPQGILFKLCEQWCQNELYQKVVNESVGRITARIFLPINENNVFKKLILDEMDDEENMKKEIVSLSIFGENKQIVQNLFSEIKSFPQREERGIVFQFVFNLFVQ